MWRKQGGRTKGGGGSEKSCANPVFEKWMAEWRQDAIAKDLQTKHTYTKCLASLRKYPLPLHSGKECVILEGFGDKICKQIDEKLSIFLNEGGVLHAESEPDAESAPSDEEQIVVAVSKQSNKRPLSTAKPTNTNTSNSNSTYKDPKSSMIESDEPKKKSKKKAEYAPEFRSGAYAILVTLYNHETNSKTEGAYMLKSELVKEAQKHSDSSFTSVTSHQQMTYNSGSYYTAWSSMATLIKRNLVLKENKLPARYSLSEEGRCCAIKVLFGEGEEIEQEEGEQLSGPKEANSKVDELIYIEDDAVVAIEEERPLVKSRFKDSDEDLPDIGLPYSLAEPAKASKISMDDLTNKKMTKTKTNNSNKVEETSLSQRLGTALVKTSCVLSKREESGPAVFTLPPGSFDVLLFVDNCEQSHAKRQDLLMDELGKWRVKYEVGKLNIGDFAWIARPKDSSKPDLVLNCIVERKRMDDFCQSIIDGRYKEQKFRLKKCGVKKLIYLIEEFGSAKHMSLPEKSLLQAEVNTQLIDHLVVHHSTDPRDSALYLAEMTQFIRRKYQNTTLRAVGKETLDTMNSASDFSLMTFTEFNQFSNKNKPMSIKEMFAKCLMRVQGVSQEKVLAIVDAFPTPDSLFKEFGKCPDETSRVKLLSGLKCGVQQRNLGPAISKIISQLFFTDAPLN